MAFHKLVPFIFAFLGLIGLAYAQTLTVSTLPIVVIDTDNRFIGDEPKIEAHMGIVDNGSTNRIDDPFNGYDGEIGIEIRGSSSQMFPKKSYGFETRKPDGSNNNVSLLGMPKENDWVLHGPYSDKSLIRNALAYYIGRKTGQYAPRTRLCELVINEEYKGVYLLVEKIKRDNNRVDISKMTLEDSTGDALTGGYLMKFDKSTGSQGFSWSTPRGDFIQLEYPKNEDLIFEQATYIKDYMAAFENALLGPDYRDSLKGYQAYIDIPSFVDFLIANEISKNVDGYRLSTFFHKKRDSEGGKIHMGPLWDFNLAFGNADYCSGGPPSGWGLRFNDFCPNDLWTINAWWDRLLSDTLFANQVIRRWRDLREGPFRTDSLHLAIDEMVSEMQSAPFRNFQKWPILSQYVWPNAFIGGNYQAEIRYLKEWVTSRSAWMDNNIDRLAPTSGPGGSPPLVVEVYPNPASHEINIRLKLPQAGNFTFLLMDLQARPVSRLNFEVEKGVQYDRTLDGLEDVDSILPAGVYIFHFYLEGNLFESGKLVKF